ncbi:MAG TPA: HAMP domain-containing protein [Aggregatilineaceae bacterium]|nr:HAMP domain-containing protein [Aggregatilineaceae bacterium]
MKAKTQQLLKALQDVSIQNKLVGIFAIVFVSGVLAIGWNIYNLNDTREHVTNTLESSKDEITSVSATSKDQVNLVFDKADELIYLQALRFGFAELEAYEKDYVLAADPEDAAGRVEGRADQSAWLKSALEDTRDLATNDTVREVAEALLVELQAQDVQFAMVVSEMQNDPQAAQQMELEGTTRKVDAIYGPLTGLVNDQWDLVMTDIDANRARMQDTLDQTDERMTVTLKETDDQMKRAINISLLTIALFALAGIVVAVTTFVVSRQIVQPVLTMSNVAEAIEKEQYQEDATASLDRIAVREDEIGKLARVFGRMASEVFARVERLKQQVAELRIVIDEQKMATQVSEITDSEYFNELQSKLKTLRRRNRPDASAELSADAGTAPKQEPPTV